MTDRYPPSSERSTGMRVALRKASALIPSRERFWWLGLIVFGVVVSLLEATGALLVLLLLRLVTAPQEALRLPVLGDLHTRFPGLSDDQLRAVIVGGIAIFFIVRGTAFLGQSYMQNRITHRAGVQLSSALMRGYLRMPWQFHLHRSSAELTRNAYEAVDDLVSYVFGPVVALASEALLILAVFAVLLAKAPLATGLTLLVVGPLVGLILWTVQPRVARMGVVHQEMAKRCLQALQQYLQGVRDIRVLGREEYFHDRFVESRREQARMQYLVRTIVDLPRLLLETILVLAILAFLAVGMLRDTSTEQSFAVLGLFAYAALRLLPSLNRVVANLNLMKFGGAAVDHVHDDLVLVKNHAESSGDRDESLTLHERLEVEGLHFRYDESARDALDGIDFVVERGQSVGIVGQTGSGKSTLVDVLLGLLHPQAGSVRVDGVDIHSCTRAWQQSLGVVHQAVFLFDDTLARNIALGVEDENIDAEALEEALELAQLTSTVTGLPAGVDTVVGERGARLSGGQRQRVAIARALYRRPDVIVFDEGTSALDSVTESELIRALDRLRGTHTLITVAHRITTVRPCDLILLMDAGRIVDSGSFDDLVERSSAFRRLAG